MKTSFVALVALAVACAPQKPPRITNGQGEMAGEVTTESVILQSRLTTGSELVDGDLPGAEGVARFEVATSPDLNAPVTTEWLQATAERDFTVKVKVDGLDAGQRYYYRLIYGPSEESTVTGPTRSFRTLDGPDAATEVSFVVVTGMNYYNFFDNPNRAYTRPDKDLGYPALQAILDLKPNFFVGTGDNVYYDVPHRGRAATAVAMRKKWHQQFVKPRYINMFAEIPTYWEKDDHDYRVNDCDNTGDYEPSPELGAAVFLEQVPVVDPKDSSAVTYRTHRVNQDLQIWLIENRDYRSPNMMEPGPDKSLWGKEQREWLQQTLLESDATFKILISPTPMIGPDDRERGGRPAEGHDEKKRDNHTNPDGFQYERNEFFQWLVDNDFLENGFYIVCGDRHWQYHSIHPLGIEEFSSGALIDANSRMGRPPGDPRSNDPDALIEQPYTYEEPTGGFLRISVSPGPEPTALFGFYEEHGELLHQVRKTAAN